MYANNRVSRRSFWLLVAWCIFLLMAWVAFVRPMAERNRRVKPMYMEDIPARSMEVARVI